MASPPPRDFQAIYDQHVPFVRNALLRRGVDAADLEDVLQETFVTVHRLLPEFEGRSSVETWLNAVAWRVAANYRRRMRRAGGAVAPAAADDEAEPMLSLERVHASFARIDDEIRDLLALHEVGGMSISALSELTGNARATIRHRLERGRAALTRALTAQYPAPERSEWLERIERRFQEPLATTELPFLRVLPCGQTCISVLDDVVIGVWRGPASNDALQVVIEALIALAHARPGGVRYLAVVERTSSPPSREGREMTTWSARKLGSKIKAVATTVEGPALMTLVSSVLNTCLFLARAPVNMRFFSELPATLAWLGQFGALDAVQMTDHVARMRACLAPSGCD